MEKLCPFVIVGALLLCGFLGPEAVAQSQHKLRFLKWTYQDAGALLQEINPKTTWYVAGSIAVLGATSQADPPLLEEVQEGYRGSISVYLDVTNELGSPPMTGITLGIFALTLVANDAHLQDAAFTSLQSLLYAGTITSALKGVFGRFRPAAGHGAYRFHPFSGNTSFPSGHTTAAFSIITPWVLYYPNRSTYGLFALCTGTAIARIALNKHWPTDVLAGGAIGFLTARYLTRRHQGATEESRVRIAPLIDTTSTGLSLRVRLD